MNHESHDVIELSKYNYSEESKNKLEELIKNIENKIKDLDVIKKDIILKDGRLASSSGDYTINIYKKNTFELQLSIKEHTSYVFFLLNYMMIELFHVHMIKQ